MRRLLDCTFNDARDAYLRNWDENTFFQMPSAETGVQYRAYLRALGDEFARCLCEEGVAHVDFDLHDRGGEGRVFIVVDQSQTYGCKLYWKDEGDTLYEEFSNSPYRGLIITGHLSLTQIADPKSTHYIYIIADAFERFLLVRGVAFARFNMGNDRKLVKQTEPCPYFGEE